MIVLGIGIHGQHIAVANNSGKLILRERLALARSGGLPIIAHTEAKQMLKRFAHGTLTLLERPDASVLTPEEATQFGSTISVLCSLGAIVRTAMPARWRVEMGIDSTVIAAAVRTFQQSFALHDDAICAMLALHAALLSARRLPDRVKPVSGIQRAAVVEMTHVT